MKIRGKNVKLSKKDIIKLHRDMWNWIADKMDYFSGKSEKDFENYLKSAFDDIINKSDTSVISIIGFFKKKYLMEHGITNVLHSCFCCEYAINACSNCNIYCKACPLIWTDINGATVDKNSGYICNCLRINENDHKGLYRIVECEICIEKNFTKAAKICRMIANLKEKEDF